MTFCLFTHWREERGEGKGRGEGDKWVFGQQETFSLFDQWKTQSEERDRERHKQEAERGRNRWNEKKTDGRRKKRKMKKAGKRM